MDIQYLMALQSFREMTHGLFNSFFLFMTQFGEDRLAFVVAMIFYYAIEKKLGRFLLIGASAADFVNGVIKLTACVYRPWIREPLLDPPAGGKTTATGYSFPSGHSTMATSIYGSSAAYYHKRTGICISFLVILAIVLFSRNYLGVHTPQDVIVGFSLTALLLFLLYKVVEWAEKGKNRDLILLGITVVLIIAAICYFINKSYPHDYNAEGKLIVDPAVMVLNSYCGCGMFLGAVLGWVIERRFINFTTDVSTDKKLLRCLSGIIIYYVVLFVLFNVFIAVLGPAAGKFAGGFAVVFYMTAVHPFVFTLVEKKRA